MTAPAAGGRGPGQIRRWLGSRTLRGRLIAGLLGLLALAFAAVGITTYAALHNFLISQLDSQVTAAGMRYAECLHHPKPEADTGDEHKPPENPPVTPESCAEQQARGAFTAQIRSGTVTSPYVAYGQCVLSHDDKAELAAAAAGGRPFTGTLPGQGTYRLMAVETPEGTPAVTYLAGLPMSPVDDTLRTILIVEAIGFAAALLLTGFLGTGYVRLSFRPLRRVAATATAVTELPLASGEVSLPDRVPYDSPRTEVGQVGAAFNRMLGHVEAALARRAASETRLRRFAADASHELRTPLAAIRGYAELARHHPGPVPGDIAHALRRVESESARMSVLVDELLLLAQLDAGRPLAREPVDLTRLAIDATSDARAAGPQHRWRLDLPDQPVEVQGDEHRLRQVLANLMSNAAKHTPAGTTVTIALAADATSGAAGAGALGTAAGAVELSVTDDGPGIPPDLLPTLFERFVRGDSARSHQPSGTSTGLGLAIVDAVTAAHGGTVTVTSRPGRTRFTIRLPAAATQGAAPAGPAPASPAPASPVPASPAPAQPGPAGPAPAGPQVSG
jgi:two-component system OmpR family sensor kinase